MHALEKLGDGRKDKGYENSESKGDQDDASEIESADHDDGYDHAEESRQVFVSGGPERKFAGRSYPAEVSRVRGFPSSGKDSGRSDLTARRVIQSVRTLSHS